MVKLLTYFILSLSFFTLTGDYCDEEFIIFEHTGEGDKPIKGIIIKKGDESFLDKKTTYFNEYLLSSLDYRIIKEFIINKDFKKDKKCRSSGYYGTFSIQVYDNNLNCYIINNKKESELFFYELNGITRKFSINKELESDFEKIVVRLVGLEEYRKRYSPYYGIDSIGFKNDINKTFN